MSTIFQYWRDSQNVPAMAGVEIPSANHVNAASDLPPARLLRVVEEYREANLQGIEVGNAEKDWDSATLESGAEVLREGSLFPDNHGP